MTKLTLVVPTYNLGQYFNAMLKTISDQTADFELWLVDDHSTDGTAERAAEFVRGVPMFHVEQFDRHRGVSVARNFGIDHASGDVVAFADGDDRLHPDFVKTLVNGFDQDTPAVTVGYEWWHTPMDPRDHYETLSQQTMFQQASQRGSEIGGYIWNKAYSLAAIERRQLRFDESLSIAEDYLFTASFVANNPGIYVYDPAIRYTKINRPNSTLRSRSFSDRRVEEQVFQRIYQMGRQL
ncbi:glycosyltransferase family 2 protein [Lactobacillus sp. LC28-10]|uniref:Glycosyltransferase family 2 protein n=1 Tax=Secundilactobacillus angelensis TaxID=2722706 RepID=A0ABX1KUK6_9LACO|nr:glycosyltransferase family A protein [Secundilactobacillus angelensis]MCH5461826.1 glycosyltransferase family 2 protein [Secundilactobacillus angelensis]NLR17314.1 glycosyltransferase family 2 protein [Secundilactobacillus angelensis]